MKILQLSLLIGMLFNTIGFGQETYYVSAQYGNDKNPGSFDQPFKSLKQASNVLTAGDTCFVFEGTYFETLKPKNVGKQGKPIVFKSLNGQKVIVSACEKLTQPKYRNKGVIEFDLDSDLGEENLVLCNGEPLILARWPNKTNAGFMDSEATEITAEGSSPTGIVAKGLPAVFTSENIKGAVVWVNADRKWSCWTSQVTGFQPEKSKIQLKGFGDNWWVNERHNPGNVHHYGPGMFYMANAEVLLDAPGEWYIDREKKKLKVILPENDQEGSIIEMKKRKWAIDLRGKSDIVVDGIDCVGAPVTFEGAQNCVVQNSEIRHFSYPMAYNSVQGIEGKNGSILYGKNNRLQHCHIWGANGNGVQLAGESNVLFNCNIHDVNCIGSHNAAPVKLEGKGHRILYNSIHNTGRDCIRLGGGAHEIAYNLIYNPGRISEDLGVLKSGGTDGDNMVIHHNIISNDNNKFIGIYFDNYTNNVIAHHNIVSGMKDGIRSNRPGHFHIIYNNTVSPDINNKYGPWEGPFDQFGCVIVNNLIEKPVMAKPEVIVANNQIVTTNSNNSVNVNKSKKIFDLPAYTGAISPENTTFKAGHDFENYPELDKRTELPFIRNHLKNGCFDYNRTYSNTSFGNDSGLSLMHWEKTGAKNAEVKYFEGFNFPTNPEHRFSIHGNSLCLSGKNTDGVRQKITTLLPSRQYTLSAYVKSEDNADAEFLVKQNGVLLASISTQQIECSPSSNWKFVKFIFELDSENNDVFIEIIKKKKGAVYIDDIGVIPEFVNKEEE